MTIFKKELTYIGIFKEYFEHTSTFIDNEIHYLFLCNLSLEIEQLNIQVEELSELKLISIAEFQKELNLVSAKKKYVPHQQNYYKIILSEISKLI